MSIRDFLGLSRTRSEPGTAAAETATVRKIVESLDRMPPDQARYLAGFAYVLSRVASADLEVSLAEREEMERLVVEHGGLGEEQAILVVQMAKTQSLLFGATENFLVTREFNRIATRDQKLALLRCLFSVSAADDSISSVEDHEIRRIADELQIEHRDFIDARLAFRQHLSVLRRPPAGPSGRD
jgi:uncharacterized tellurite resistance protein B-like protein